MTKNWTPRLLAVGGTVLLLILLLYEEKSTNPRRRRRSSRSTTEAPDETESLRLVVTQNLTNEKSDGATPPPPLALVVPPVAASARNRSTLSWEQKLALAVSLDLPTGLPPPYENVKWGRNSRDNKKVQQLIDKVASLLLEENILKNIFLEGGTFGVYNFRITSDDGELLIAIGVLRVLHQDYSCSYPGCYPVLLTSFRKVLLAYDRYRRAASWFLSQKQPLTTPYDINALWTSLYSTIGCSDSPRECHLADGCRFFCNPKTFKLQGADKKRGGLNVVSLGSNNMFDYEESIVRTYGAESVNSMAVFDCTVAPDKLTNLPNIVRDLPGFRYVNKCFVSHTLRGPPKGQPPFRANDLVKETGNHSHVDIFKMDIEGSEFGAIHELLVEQLKFDLLGDGTPPTFSILQFEMHLGYHNKRRLAAAAIGASMLQAGHVGHLCFLELYALGFNVARMERNPWWGQNTEVMLPHSTFFVESEVNEFFL